ncbi:MAG: gamma-glutamylcyclotransferase [Rubrobacter sp.]|nr:gamma-glutamylcyclotransferase [Rubrobacter sp.]
MYRAAEDAPGKLGVFVYGTLKHGLRNHDRFCGGYLRVEEATVCGRLYDLPAGFPALVVPEENIAATGSADPAGDAALQARMNAASPRAQQPPAGGWDTVRGEYFVFGDPARRLPALDLLEGFAPGETGLYQRALVPVGLPARDTGLFAWAYTRRTEEGRYLPGGQWPPATG